MNTQSKRDFIINVTYYSIILVLAYLGMKYFFGILFPFVLGFLIAFSLKPLIRFIVKKTKINNKVVSLLILLIFYTLIGFALFFAIVRSVSYLSTLFEQIPAIYTTDIQPLITSFANWVSDLIIKIDPSFLHFIQQFEETFIDSMANFVKTFSSTSLSLLTGLITKVPSFFLSFFFSVISSFFITLDYEKITNFLTSQFSGKSRQLFRGVQKNSISVLVNFFKAYAVLMTITFVEAAIGLKILGYTNPIGIAIIIALVDIFPVLGTGTILVPWTIVEFLNGNVPSAIGLLVLYLVITVVRQIIEPRIVGEQIGLYPLVTLICMYLGTTYFGIVGLFAVPIIVTVLVKLQEDGFIQFYKHPKVKGEKKQWLILIKTMF